MAIAGKGGVGKTSITGTLVVEAYGESPETGRRVAVLAPDLGLPRVGLIAKQGP